MTNMDFINNLTITAQVYREIAMDSIKRNHHMNDRLSTDKEIEQKDIDAILVDFINFCGQLRGMDVGLYTCDIIPNNEP